MTARGRDRLIALTLALATTSALSLTHQQVGYVRDEGIYFVAGRSYAAWLGQLARSPGAAMTADVRDRAFAINHEHPALMKALGGLSGRLLARPTVPVQDAAVNKRDPPVRGWLPRLPEGAAMRLPAQLLAGLAAALLYLAAARRTRSALAGLLAAGWFILLPRVWFHAGLDCFDVPIATLTLAVALAYHRALGDWRWGLALGPLVGLAISIKHNALFLPILLGLHYLACLLLRRLESPPERPRAPWGRALVRLLPLPFVSVAALAPVVFLALWPWLWRDPIARVHEYFAFHLHHSWYNIEFLGVNYNRPPMPTSLPAVLTWATIPTTLLALALAGVALLLARDLGPALRRFLSRGSPDSTPDAGDDDAPAPSWSSPLPAARARREGLLIALLGLFPIALISSPNVPVFGGTKHWITALPFLALAAASAWAWLWRALEPTARWRRVAPAAALALVLTPGAWSTAAGHPYNLSQYAPLVGGARGAAELGLARGFWGHAVLGLLPELEAAREQGRSALYLHDIHELARLQYAREGRWPEGLVPAPAGRAELGLLFYERHMLTYETELWRAQGSTAPSGLLELHDVPLTSLYARPR